MCGDPSAWLRVGTASGLQSLREMGLTAGVHSMNPGCAARV